MIIEDFSLRVRFKYESRKYYHGFMILRLVIKTYLLLISTIMLLLLFLMFFIVYLSKFGGVWSIGPDGLLGNFLFELRLVIAYPLWIIFRRSLDGCIFPSMLKFCSVSPVSQSGNSAVVFNYQPISIQSCT